MCSKGSLMQKYLPYLFIFALFIAVCIAGCGGGTSALTPVFNYALPTSLAPSPHTPLMGGAIQGTPLVLGNTVSTLAGTSGSAGFINYSSTSGTAAMFNLPNDITTDGANFYVADYGNNAIRQITHSGVVRTLQYTDVVTGVAVGFNRPSGITTDGINLYVADTVSNTIRFIDIATNKVTIIGSTTGLAGSVDSTDKTVARFNQPIGTTTDGVNVYVTDYNNATVRRIDIATKAVYTLAGTSGTIGTTDGTLGDARFNRPGRITTDGVNLYLTDFINRTIRQIVISTGVVTTVAGSTGPLSKDDGTLDGIGTAARFNQPDGITTDGTNLYVTDIYQNTIRKIVISTGVVTTISGISGTAGVGGSVDSPGTPSFFNPIGITTDGAGLFVADSFNNTIRKIR
jgi:DNA-binding beta-propeller fold protein YncE